jgi:lactoylglutathione lyase
MKKSMWMTAGLVALLGMVYFTTYGVFAQTTAESNIANATIDLGVVVSDIDKAVKWYTDVVGFNPVTEFGVPGDFAKQVGLTNSIPAHIHVLALGDGPGATKVKLMQFKQAPGARIDQTYFHSTYGFRYLTIFVKDMPTAMARAAKHGAKPISGDAITIPESVAPGGNQIAVLRDPDGNFVELVGPKAP